MTVNPSFIREPSSATAIDDSPKNLIVFIRDQVKPTDLWFPRGWDDNNMPTQKWLKDNGLSFSNSFTNASMCSVSRSTFFTSKYPAQHQADLILSDIKNPVLDSQVQLNPDLPNLGNIVTQDGVSGAYSGPPTKSRWVAPKGPRRNRAECTRCCCVMPMAPPLIGGFRVYSI